MSVTHSLLCINAGSSSLKISSFIGADEALERIGAATVQGIGQPEGRLTVRDADGIRENHAVCIEYDEALALWWARLQPHCPEPAAVGHRFVHGGTRFVEPTLVTDAVVAELETLVPLAPLHLPPALGLLRAARTRWSGVPHVLCFDTAFHAGLPELAQRLPIPARYPEVKRYGFHGLSYEHVVATLGASLGRRSILAHLGSGASLVALDGGAPIDTTMGFTPAGGIAMGTRPGDLDPGVLLYLARSKGMTLDQLDAMVEHESGLAAVGGTSDMQALLSLRETDASARDAVAMFVQGVRKAIGAYAAILGGLDSLVFTGGIGEHAPMVRAEICQTLGFLGIQVDSERNARNARTVHTGACTVHVIETEEDRTIARNTARALR